MNDINNESRVIVCSNDVTIILYDHWLQAPQLETVTRETVETFNGGRRITTSEKRDVQPAPPDTLLLPRSNGEL